MSLQASWSIFRHELRVLVTDPGTVIFVILMPLVMVTLMKELFAGQLAAQGFTGANGSESAVPGMAVAFAAFGVGYAGFTFFRDHGWGTWDRLRATPASAVDIMVGKVTPTVLVSVTQLGLLFSLGGPLFGLRITSLSRTMNQLNAVGGVGGMAMAMLGGAWVPLAVMPGWAQAIAPALPTYWAMEGFSDVILEGGGMRQVVVPVIVMTGFVVLFTALAAWRSRFEDTKVYYG